MFRKIIKFYTIIVLSKIFLGIFFLNFSFGYADLLVDEAQKGNLQKVKELIKAGADINAKNEYGVTPLYAACARGHKETAAYLLDIGAQAGTSTDHSFTPLMMASSKGWYDIVSRILEHGPDVNATSDNGLRAINEATSKGEIEIVKLLIKSGAQINTQIDIADPPLLTAIESGKKELVEFFIENGAEFNRFAGKTRRNRSKGGYVAFSSGNQISTSSIAAYDPLLIAIQYGYEDIALYLLSKDAPIHDLTKNQSIITLNMDFNSPLLTALRKGLFRVSDILISKDESFNQKGSALLLRYLNEKKWDVVKYLCLKGVNINFFTPQGDTPLMLAACQGDEALVKFLIENGADINLKMSKPGNTQHNGTALVTAAACGKDTIVSYLISKGAELNAVNSNGSSAIIAASASGFRSIVETLIQKGANINIENQLNNSPLKKAIEKKHFDIAEILIKHGADINAKCMQGFLLLSINSQKTEAVRFLIENSYDINTPFNGSTPLIGAVDQGNVDTIKLLLSHGADINHVPERDLPALSLASKKGDLEIVKLLISNKADINIKAYRTDETPILISSKAGHAEVVKELLKAGADVNSMNKAGETPYFVANMKKYGGVLKVLDAHGADRSSTERMMKSVRLLQEKGIFPSDIKDENLEGLTPLKVNYLIEYYEKLYGIDDLSKWSPKPIYSTPEKTWEVYQEALINGTIERATSCFSPDQVKKQKQILETLGREQMKKIAQNMFPIEKIQVDSHQAKYRIKKIESIQGNEKEITCYIYFTNILGEWKIVKY